MTNLWEALDEASEELSTYSKKYPNAKKSILVLSDGEDTSGRAGGSFPTSWRLQTANVIVDTFFIGRDLSCNELKAISHAYTIFLAILIRQNRRIQIRCINLRKRSSHLRAGDCSLGNATAGTGD